MAKSKTDDEMMDAIAVIQEALIDLYLNVKVRSKEEISDYDEQDLVKERDNLYLTSPLDLINYIQTSVEILMNIKVDDYLVHKKDVAQRKKMMKRKNEKLGNKSKLLQAEEELSKRLNDSNASDHDNSIDLKQGTEKGERLDTDNFPDGNNEAGNKKEAKNFNTITSNKEESHAGEGESSQSFIPFSQRTSLTHAPTIYEELIQKYEGDIRNHIRIEQQMKLHSDSVLNKLEDKEKLYDKAVEGINKQERRFKELETSLKMEAKVLREENGALKKALEKKIEKILALESNLKESSVNYSKLENEIVKIKKKFRSGDITPNINENSLKGKTLGKNKYKINSANPNSGRKGNSSSVQLFYSRNIKGPNNVGREEFIIPATSTRSPDKIGVGQPVNKSIVLKKDGKSPYIHADLERLKQYINMPKSKTRKTIKSALRTKHLHTDEGDDRKIRDYNSMQNSIVYRGSKEGRHKPKSHKSSKHKHFMSYDAKSSNMKYYDFGSNNFMDNSMDRIHKRKMSKSTKMKAKRNSSISKMFKVQNSVFMNNTSSMGGYGGANMK